MPEVLTIHIPAGEFYDAKNNKFINTKAQTLTLKHSLVSISKWEAEFKKPFLSDTPMTLDESMYYVQCMTMTQNVDPMVYRNLTQENYDEVREYINDPMTASKVTNNGGTKGRSSEYITSELIYYWMTAFNIPSEYQKWHLNRLIMLIEICNAKNQPPKKQSRAATLAQYKALNAKRRAKKK